MQKIYNLFNNTFFSLLSFAAAMYLVFYLTFDSAGAQLNNFMSQATASVTDIISRELMSLGVNPAFHSLIVDGICSGIGSVLSFVPTISILFFFIAIMESSGFMALTAASLDNLLGRAGLPGIALVPLTLGFGCSVPAILATRSLPSRRDRLITIAMIPFISCSARLPVYLVIISVFFPAFKMPVLAGIYFTGIATAFLASLIVRRVTGAHTSFHKKRAQDGIKDSFAHMSPARSDASQGSLLPFRPTSFVSGLTKRTAQWRSHVGVPIGTLPFRPTSFASGLTKRTAQWRSHVGVPIGTLPFYPKSNRRFVDKTDSGMHNVNVGETPSYRPRRYFLRYKKRNVTANISAKLNPPSARYVLSSVITNTSGFVKKAFTVIFMASVIIWFMQNFDSSLHMTDNSEESMLADLGKMIAPVFSPLGFDDWRAATAILAGLSAKEAIVSTLSVLSYTAPGASITRLLDDIFTPLSAFSFMVFCLLYAPCAASVSAILKETGSMRYTAAILFMQLSAAWIISFVIFQTISFISIALSY